MRIDSKAFGIAAGTVAGALFTLCALTVAIAPGATTAFFGYLLHLDLSGLARPLTWSSYAAGLVCWTLGTALTFGIAAAIYNRLASAPSLAGAPSREAVARR